MPCLVFAAVDPAAAPLNPRFTGTPPSRTWTAEEYGAHPENHCVVQHPATGFIYVGNMHGVLEFDGARWRLVATPGAVRGLAVDALGRVWGAGAMGQFRLRADARGEWQIEMITPRLPEGFRAYGPINACLATSEGVYYHDLKKLIRFPLDEGPPQVMDVSGQKTLLGAAKIGDEIHFVIDGREIVRLRGGKLERMPGLDGGGILAARQAGEGVWQLATSRGAVWWDERKIEAGENPFAASGGARAAAVLSDGRVAYGTTHQGVVICGPDGRVLQRIDRAKGLPANLVNGVIEDREGGVWVALRLGIVRLQLDSPYARHGTTELLEGTVYGFGAHRGRLFVASSEGIAERLADGRFQPVAGLRGPDRDLAIHDGWLFAQGSRLRAVPLEIGGPARELENRNYYGLVPLAIAPGFYAHGSNEGLRWAGFTDGKWASHGWVNSASGASTVWLESPAGVVWATNLSSLLRTDFRGGLRRDAPTQRFSTATGLPGRPWTAFQLGGRVVTLAGGKLLRYDEERNRFEPETRIAGLEDFAVDEVHPVGDGTFWLRAAAPRRDVRRMLPAGSDRWQCEPLPGPPLGAFSPTRMYHEAASDTLWQAGHGALISRDLAWRPAREPLAPVVHVRRIETAAGELVVVPPPRNTARKPSPPPLTLPKERTSLRFAFAAPTFVPDLRGVTHTRYRTRLDGLDADWTAWSLQTERDFTNLAWRSFTFRVQGSDDAGRVGPESTLAFTIVPAWWATRWAKAGYALLGVAALAGLVRLRTHTLHRRAARLEAIVAERTGELARSNAELARLRQIDRDEKVAAQLGEEKARLEVLRYQLNPHFLYNSLNSIYGLLFENARAAGEMVLRLSAFCRATLTSSGETQPTLGVEIEALRTYLEVEKIRWRDSLQLEFDIAENVAAVPVPPFLLLPLVENAVKYGSRTSPGTLRLRLSARFESGVPAPVFHDGDRLDFSGATVLIEVANTGAWLVPDGNRPDSTGIGLENLRARLARYYPDAHHFTTEATEGWVIARLRLELKGGAAELGASPAAASAPDFPR